MDGLDAGAGVGLGGQGEQVAAGGVGGGGGGWGVGGTGDGCHFDGELADFDGFGVDGGLETHRDAMERLLDVTGLPREDLFRSREELVSQALSRQEGKVAYVDEKLAAEASGNLS